MKFNRNYELTINPSSTRPFDPTLTIKPPFTIEFDITRNILASANVCSIRIYNLSLVNRNNLLFNVFDSNDFRKVELKAGYGNNMPVIFSGNINKSFSMREGINFITSIECFDGGFAFLNSTTSQQFSAGTPQKIIIKSLISDLDHVTEGAIGDFPSTNSRGTTYSGNTCEILREITNGSFNIDNGKAYCLGNNECISNGHKIINSASGLLGTPAREASILTFDMIFEPSIIVNQIMILNSITGANFNGAYKVQAVKHRGVISEAVCGDAITTLTMFYGTSALTTV